MFIPSLFVPKWVQSYWYTYKSEKEIPSSLYTSIRTKIENFHSNDKPLVTVGIIAYNEEQILIRSIASLADQKTNFPVEFLCVNNNSKDQTSEIIKKTGVKYVFQPKQGLGNARQAGMENARGKYYLTADADTIYPPYWLDTIVKKLHQPGIVATYGKASFYSEDLRTSRFGFAVYEFLKYIVHVLRGTKRPELSVQAYSFGIITELGFKSGGWNTLVLRGEDGDMAYHLTKIGKVIPIRSRRTRSGWSTGL